MSEKLTVAELLARNGRNEDSAEAGRPKRRRRSLEDGGVSVAELTGSIPVVEESDISESRAEGAVPGKKAEPSVKGGGGAASGAAVEKPSIKKVRPMPQTKVAPAERPEEKTGKLAAVEEDPKKPQQIEDLEQTQKSGSFAKPDNTVKQGAAAGAGVVGSAAGTGRADSAAAAASRVDIRPADGKTADGEPEAEKSEVKKPEVKKPAAMKSADAGVAGSNAPFKKRVGTLGSTGINQDTKPAEDAAFKAEDPDKAQAPVAPEEFHELEANLAEDEVLEFEDDRISWPAMLAQAVGAIIAGVGVFFAFSLLWDKAPGALVLVLALAVTMVMVGLVHALLRHHDKLLMILAFFVGLVLTVGPRLILGV